MLGYIGFFFILGASIAYVDIVFRRLYGIVRWARFESNESRVMTTATAIVATVWALVSMVVGMIIVSLPGLIVIQTVRIAGAQDVFLSASPLLLLVVGLVGMASGMAVRRHLLRW